MAENEQIEEPNYYDVEKDGIPSWALPDVPSNILEFADKSELYGRCSIDLDGDNLWVWLEDQDEPMDFGAVAVIFTNPEKTSKITYHSASMTTPTYEDFTRMVGIEVDKAGRYTVHMKQP